MLLKYAISGSFRSAATVSIRVSKRQPRARDPNDRHHPRHKWIESFDLCKTKYLRTPITSEDVLAFTAAHACMLWFETMRCNAVERPHHNIPAFITGWFKRELVV